MNEETQTVANGTKKKHNQTENWKNALQLSKWHNIYKHCTILVKKNNFKSSTPKNKNLKHTNYNNIIIAI